MPDPIIDSNALEIDEITIWVDPLDGTQGFIRGELQSVTVMIGVAVAGVPLFGVVHQPFENNTYWGGIWYGLWNNTKKIEPEIQQKQESIIFSKYNINPKQLQFFEGLREDYSLTRCSGAGYKAIMVALGYHDLMIYPGPNMKKWDACAAECLLKAAGGIGVDMTGRAYSYSPEDNYFMRNGIIWGRNVPAVLGIANKYEQFLNEYKLYNN